MEKNPYLSEKLKMKLNQVIAIEKDAKAQSNSALDTTQNLFKKSPLFTGYIKQYQSFDDEARAEQPETGRVQHTVENLLRDVRKSMTKSLNLTATKDFSNCDARADVTIKDQTIVSNVPATHLLYLEKVLTRWKDFILSIPTLDASVDWVKDDAQGLMKIKEPKKSHRMKKTRKHTIVHPPTPQHPAITDHIDEDVAIGEFTLTLLLDRVSELHASVKTAREEANTLTVSQGDVADRVFDYLLGA
jgi:hypothetical protein